MTKRRSAYELPFARVALNPDEQRAALRWWQRGEEYHPLTCPVCNAVLVLAEEGPVLRCPTVWCSFVLSDIPWGVYAAWQRRAPPAGTE